MDVKIFPVEPQPHNDLSASYICFVHPGSHLISELHSEREGDCQSIFANDQQGNKMFSNPQVHEYNDTEQNKLYKWERERDMIWM